jgi:hypothetical protein
MTTLPLVFFGNTEKLKADSLIERAVDANHRRIRNESQQSDTRIRERLQGVAEVDYLCATDKPVLPGVLVEFNPVHREPDNHNKPSETCSRHGTMRMVRSKVSECTSGSLFEKSMAGIV